MTIPVKLTWLASVCVLPFLGAAPGAVAQDFACSARSTTIAGVYNLGVTGAGTPLGGFTAGYPGGTVTSMSIEGFPGTPDTSGLPAGTSLGVFAAIPAGQPVTIVVGTSGPAPTAFFVAPINASMTGYLPGFTCPVGVGGSDTGTGSPPATSSGPFVDARTSLNDLAITDFNNDGAPDIGGVLPGPGTIIVLQVAAAHDVLRSLSRDASPASTRHGAFVRLVQPLRVVVRKAGKVRATLLPTAAGKAFLARKGRFTVRVRVTFTTTAGKAASRTQSVTFRRRK